MIIAALLLAVCVPSKVSDGRGGQTVWAPVVQWDQPQGTVPTVAYSLYYNQIGGTPQLVVDLPCDLDQDVNPAVRTCRGLDFGAALQRYCVGCHPLEEYEFAVKSKAADGTRSTAFSNTVQICFPAVCPIDHGYTPGTCN